MNMKKLILFGVMTLMASIQSSSVAPRATMSCAARR